jgi:hypothetical protein
MNAPIRHAAAACCVLLSIVPAFAQSADGTSARMSAPPIQGVMALDDAMRKFYRAVNVGLVAAREGVDHAYRFTASLIGHPADNPGGRTLTALEGLREGTVVVVQFNVRVRGERGDAVDLVSDKDLMATEGRVVHIDRRRQQITVTYDDGTFDVMELTERAGAATWPEEEQAIAAQAAGAQAAVYYNDEDGQRVVHFFRWIR